MSYYFNNGTNYYSDKITNAKKVEDIFDDIVYAKIEDIELTESENYKVKISIRFKKTLWQDFNAKK